MGRLTLPQSWRWMISVQDQMAPFTKTSGYNSLEAITNLIEKEGRSIYGIKSWSDRT
jgi:hypothetical protein